jgi:hypothetical protein
MSSALSLQLESKTGTDQFLTYDDGSGELLDFFSGQSAPYGDFAAEVQPQEWTGQPSALLATNGGKWRITVQVGGDYLCNTFVRIGVPAIFNQCNGSLDATSLTLAASTTADSQYRFILPSGPAASGQASVAIADGVLGATAGVTDVDGTDDDTSPTVLTSTVHAASGWFVAAGDVANATDVAAGLQYAFVPENHKALAKANANLGTGGATGQILMAAGQNPQDVAPYFCDMAAIAFITSYQTKLGQNELDTIYTENFVVYHELYVPKSKRADKALNHHPNPQVLKARAMRSQTWYVQVPNFWSSGSYLKAYPAASCQLTKMYINIETKSLYQVIVNGCGSTFNTASKGSYSSVTISTAEASFDTISVASLDTKISGFALTDTASTPLTNGYIDQTHFSMDVLMEWVLLPDDERTAMVGVQDTMLITQHSRTEMAQITAGGSQLTQDIEQMHPVAAFHILGRLHSKLYQNKLCDYSGLGNPLTATNDEPDGVCKLPWIKQLGMKFNNSMRFPSQGPDYYLQVENALHAEQVPDFEHGMEIYSMHFCLGSPYAPQASGSCNPARIEYKKILFTPSAAPFADNTPYNGLNGDGTSINSGKEKIDAWLLDIHYNVAVIKNNMIGVLYS